MRESTARVTVNGEVRRLERQSPLVSTLRTAQRNQWRLGVYAPHPRPIASAAPPPTCSDSTPTGSSRRCAARCRRRSTSSETGRDRPSRSPVVTFYSRAGDRRVCTLKGPFWSVRSSSRSKAGSSSPTTDRPDRGDERRLRRRDPPGVRQRPTPTPTSPSIKEAGPGLSLDCWSHRRTGSNTASCGRRATRRKSPRWRGARYMESTGTGTFLEFREGGVKGVAALRDAVAGEGVDFGERAIDPVVFGRDDPDVLSVADGYGRLRCPRRRLRRAVLGDSRGGQAVSGSTPASATPTTSTPRWDRPRLSRPHGPRRADPPRAARSPTGRPWPSAPGRIS